MTENDQNTTEDIDREWSQWASVIEDDVFDVRFEEGVITPGEANGGFTPILSIVNGEPTLGNSVFNDRYLNNEGQIKGKIAIFIKSYNVPLIVHFDKDVEFSFRDEVLDASAYFDDNRSAFMPFDESYYARVPEECETLIIIQPYLATGYEKTVGPKTELADTEVVIIDAENRKL